MAVNSSVLAGGGQLGSGSMIRVVPVQDTTDEGEGRDQGAPAPRQRETCASLILLCEARGYLNTLQFFYSCCASDGMRHSMISTTYFFFSWALPAEIPSALPSGPSEDLPSSGADLTAVR